MRTDDDDAAEAMARGGSENAMVFVMVHGKLTRFLVSNWGFVTLKKNQ
jgi:hypothetical protein